MKHPDGVVRVGGVGTGRIFQWAHTRVYPKLLEKGWLVGFFDLNPERAEKARTKYRKQLEEYANERPGSADAVAANIAELRCYESLDALLDDVDVIDVATYAQGRMATAIAALEKGVHAMVEKPMARTWTEADRAARVAARQPGVFLQLNDDDVFSPSYGILRALIAGGAIGKVQHLTLSRGSSLASTSVLKAQASAAHNGGGCMMDYGSHALDAIAYVLGAHLSPVKVDSVSIDVLFPHRVLEGEPYVMEVDDNARFKVLLKDPKAGSWTTVYIETTWCGRHIGFDDGVSLRILGDEGVIERRSSDRHCYVVRKWDGGETVVPLRKYPGESISFDHQIGSFLDCVRTGVPPEIDVHFGAEVIAVCGAAYLSAIRGRAISLKEFKDFSRGYIEKYGDNELADDAIVLDLTAPYRAK